MNWFQNHIPHIATGGILGGGGFWLIFREEIREYLKGRREERKAAAEATLTRLRLETEAKAQGEARHDSMTMKTLSMIEENLKSERETRAAMATTIAKMEALLDRLTVAVEKFPIVNEKINSRLARIEGAHGIHT